jgi:hypothetical protein
MRMKPQRIQLLLAIMTSFVIAAYPVYLQYSIFNEIDFLSTHASFENLDQENLLADEQNKTRIFLLNSCPEVFLLGAIFEEQSLRLSFRVLSGHQTAPILRC